MSENEFQLVKIQTHVLKVQIHCDGCARKVKKLLKRIEGVYLVSIDTEEQKVKVSGIVDSATLIKKLTKSGKHAELWTLSNKENQNLQGLTNWLLDDKFQNSLQYPPDGVNASNTQPLFASEFNRGIDNRNDMKYLNESAGKSLMNQTNNSFRTATVGDGMHFAWDGDMIPDTNSPGPIDFPDSSKHAGAFAGYEDKGFPAFAGYEDRGYPVLQNFQAIPSYEHYYSPLMMRNNLQKQYQYNLPSPMMMMMNNDIPDMHAIYNSRMNGNSYLHQSQGFVNPILLPVDHHSWNYY